MNILLDYFLKIDAINPTPAANTAFLNQVAVVVNPKAGVTEGSITPCTTQTEVAALTDNDEVQQLLAGGMSKVYVIVKNDLDIDAILDANLDKFFTLLISSDFNETEFGTIELGSYKGVVGVSSNDKTFLDTQAVVENRSAWYTNVTNGAKNMFYCFGKLLSASTWRNQQYIQVPFDDGVSTLGNAETYFDDRISFAMNDAQFGKRLGFFVAGGKAITSPYILKNFEIDLQSKGLQFVSGTQPTYTVTNGVLLEDELLKVRDDYVNRGLIFDGTIEIELTADDFVVNGKIDVAPPKALWRGKVTLGQTL